MLIFPLRNSLRSKCYAGFMKLHNSPFFSLFVLFLTFFHFYPQFLPISIFFFFFLKVWINFSKIYRWMFALSWAPPSSWFARVCILLDHPSPLSANVIINPVDTGRRLNVHKTFRRRPGRLLNVLRTFNLRPVSTGECPLYDCGGCNVTYCGNSKRHFVVRIY